MPEVVSFVGASGSGKTTLLEKVIPELVRRGVRVGAIKHDAHRFEIDHPGKDSHRLAAAGAAVTLICSPEKLALVRRHDTAPPVEEIHETYFDDLDLVLVEGFRRSALPKIEVHRRGRGAELICRGAERDERLDLDSPVAVAEFLLSRLPPRATTAMTAARRS